MKWDAAVILIFSLIVTFMSVIIKLEMDAKIMGSKHPLAKPDIVAYFLKKGETDNANTSFSSFSIPLTIRTAKTHGINYNHYGKTPKKSKEFKDLEEKILDSVMIKKVARFMDRNPNFITIRSDEYEKKPKTDYLAFANENYYNENQNIKYYENDCANCDGYGFLDFMPLEYQESYIEKIFTTPVEELLREMYYGDNVIVEVENENHDFEIESRAAITKSDSYNLDFSLKMLEPTLEEIMNNTVKNEEFRLNEINHYYIIDKEDEILNFIKSKQSSDFFEKSIADKNLHFAIQSFLIREKAKKCLEIEEEKNQGNLDAVCLIAIARFVNDEVDFCLSNYSFMSNDPEILDHCIVSLDHIYFTNQTFHSADFDSKLHRKKLLELSRNPKDEIDYIFENITYKRSNRYKGCLNDYRKKKRRRFGKDYYYCY
ncbi:hypothetical protein EDEG_02033 [Edhazardia aedis USNM 41457]|uniref:Uncharacterized protein n=1 Tax=Edhazardia aedis (strain USNM 41457) TaxID=1003232 RepID=J9D785_EDHAE|nr:hypothetical protein EDEG_02033 [Edhazardia aedis USNM 41457]|eukprot:EJW03636.1 hypothetical protein EDEG_02033 [Edhazardia aedis USNM 41457]